MPSPPPAITTAGHLRPPPPPEKFSGGLFRSRTKTLLVTDYRIPITQSSHSPPPTHPLNTPPRIIIIRTPHRLLSSYRPTTASHTTHHHLLTHAKLPTATNLLGVAVGAVVVIAPRAPGVGLVRDSGLGCWVEAGQPGTIGGGVFVGVWDSGLSGWLSLLVCLV
ncbi:hypothetical protein Tco_1133121 [Tanacetum coccineum]|uniref:Uncharacterized protein n=1 Tax=Tanacetum coccineum TaxID=301880 RepID=A0ABQ5JDU8_9ASTR